MLQWFRLWSTIHPINYFHCAFLPHYKSLVIKTCTGWTVCRFLTLEKLIQFNKGTNFHADAQENTCINYTNKEPIEIRINGHTGYGENRTVLTFVSGRLWGNNHCCQTSRQNSRQTDNHTEGTLGYVLITDAHLVDTAYICWRVEPLGWMGERERGREGWRLDWE